MIVVRFKYSKRNNSDTVIICQKIINVESSRVLHAKNLHLIDSNSIQDTSRLIELGMIDQKCKILPLNHAISDQVIAIELYNSGKLPLKINIGDRESNLTEVGPNQIR